jgi:hypothetical protein
MQVNVTFNVSDSQARELLASLLGGEKPTIETVPEPAVEKRKKVAEEPKKEEPKKVETKYTIESIRKAAKDAAREKGQPFVKQALDSVGATSISKIEPDKFDEFMHLLIDEK